MDAAGNDFAFTWEGVPAGPFVIDARVFKFSTGAANTNDFQVSSPNTSAALPWISMDAGGDLVVSFGVDTSTRQHPNMYEVFFGIFSTSGTREVNNTGLTGTHSTSGPDHSDSGWGPAVSMDANGDFVITWQNLYSPSSQNTELGIYAEVFTAANYSQGVSPTANGILTVYDDHAKASPDVPAYVPSVAVNWSPGLSGDYYWTDAWTQPQSSPTESNIDLQQYKQVGGTSTASGGIVVADVQNIRHASNFNYESIATEKGGTNNNGDVSVTWNGSGVQAVSLTSSSDNQPSLIVSPGGRSSMGIVPPDGNESATTLTIAPAQAGTAPIVSKGLDLQGLAIRSLVTQGDLSTFLQGRRGLWSSDRVASGDLLIT